MRSKRWAGRPCGPARPRRHLQRWVLGAAGLWAGESLAGPEDSASKRLFYLALQSVLKLVLSRRQKYAERNVGALATTVQELAEDTGVQALADAHSGVRAQAAASGLRQLS